MSKNQLAVLDTGEANRRILAKDEYRADFRRVEAASLKRRTRLASAEGKRMATSENPKTDVQACMKK